MIYWYKQLSQVESLELKIQSTKCRHIHIDPCAMSTSCPYLLKVICAKNKKCIAKQYKICVEYLRKIKMSFIGFHYEQDQRENFGGPGKGIEHFMLYTITPSVQHHNQCIVLQLWSKGADLHPIYSQKEQVCGIFFKDRDMTHLRIDYQIRAVMPQLLRWVKTERPMFFLRGIFDHVTLERLSNVPWKVHNFPHHIQKFPFFHERQLHIVTNTSRPHPQSKFRNAKPLSRHYDHRGTESTIYFHTQSRLKVYAKSERQFNKGNFFVKVEYSSLSTNWIEIMMHVSVKTCKQAHCSADLMRVPFVHEDQRSRSRSEVRYLVRTYGFSFRVTQPNTVKNYGVKITKMEILGHIWCKNTQYPLEISRFSFPYHSGRHNEVALLAQAVVFHMVFEYKKTPPKGILIDTAYDLLVRHHLKIKHNFVSKDCRANSTLGISKIFHCMSYTSQTEHPASYIFICPECIHAFYRKCKYHWQRVGEYHLPGRFAHVSPSFSWTTALVQCQQVEGHLPIFLGKTEFNDFMNILRSRSEDFFPATEIVYIGIKDKKEKTEVRTHMVSLFCLFLISV